MLAIFLQSNPCLVPDTMAIVEQSSFPKVESCTTCIFWERAMVTSIPQTFILWNATQAQQCEFWLLSGRFHLYIWLLYCFHWPRWEQAQMNMPKRRHTKDSNSFIAGLVLPACSGVVVRQMAMQAGKTSPAMKLLLSLVCLLFNMSICACSHLGQWKQYNNQM